MLYMNRVWIWKWTANKVNIAVLLEHALTTCYCEKIQRFTQFTQQIDSFNTIFNVLFNLVKSRTVARIPKDPEVQHAARFWSEINQSSPLRYLCLSVLSPNTVKMTKTKAGPGPISREEDKYHKKSWITSAFDQGKLLIAFEIDSYTWRFGQTCIRDIESWFRNLEITFAGRQSYATRRG